jgi:hypothetical protein
LLCFREIDTGPRTEVYKSTYSGGMYTLAETTDVIQFFVAQETTIVLRRWYQVGHIGYVGARYHPQPALRVLHSWEW